MRFYLAFLFILILLSCNRVTERMEGYEVHGIDISHYQQAIQWDTIARQDIDFAFVKATEGNTLQDGRYCFNWEEMKRVGIKRGAYHFFRPQVPVEWQVQNYLDQVELKAGDLPPVLDVEVTDGLDKKSLVEAVRSWLLQVEYAYQVRPIIYSNYNFYLKYLSEDLAAYPVWIARYSDYTPRLSGRQWQFWQYGNKGRLKGIEGDVDFNVFHGTREELEKLSVTHTTLLRDAEEDQVFQKISF